MSRADGLVRRLKQFGECEHAAHRHGRARAFSRRAKSRSARTFSKLEFNHTDNITFSVPISGVGVVLKLGIGTTTLTGANTFTGSLNVNAGIVELRGAPAISRMRCRSMWRSARSFGSSIHRPRTRRTW